MQASAPNKSNSNTTVALPAPISTPAMKTDQVQTGGFICVGPPCPIDTQSEFESIRTQENSTPIHILSTSKFCRLKRVNKMVKSTKNTLWIKLQIKGEINRFIHDVRYGVLGRSSW